VTVMAADAGPPLTLQLTPFYLRESAFKRRKGEVVGMTGNQSSAFGLAVTMADLRLGVDLARSTSYRGRR
jgi:hypothetical protein